VPTSGAASPQGYCDLFSLLALGLRRQQLGLHGVKRSDDSEKRGKGKVHPRTGHEDPGVGYKYSSTLSLTSALDEGGCLLNVTPRPLYPRERPGTHCIGGWVGPRAGLDRC